MYQIATRLGFLLLTMVVAITIVFILVHRSGDPTDGFLAPGSAPEVRAATRARLGLDRPLPEQYLQFLTRGLLGDFGDSWRNRQPALQTVLQRLPATLLLAGIATLVAVTGGMGIGVISATSERRSIRGLARTVALLGLAIPSFWLGTIGIMVFAVHLGWVPSSGKTEWASLVLPALTLAAYPGALIARLIQSSLIDVSTQPYVTMARAKGLRPRSVWLRHALPNALLPAVGAIGVQAGFLVGGTVVVESVFAYPGVGRLAMQATTDRDLPVIQAFVALTIVLVAFINIAIDVIAAAIDPTRTTSFHPGNGRG